MSTSALIVEVQDTERGQRQEYVFARSPIRVGRSPLNDLPLERPFVSHCHGLMHFDDTLITFVDVGSTNGTFLGRNRLEKNRRTSLSAGDVIAIGALRLRVRTDRREAAGVRASYAFHAGAFRAEHPAEALPAGSRAAQTPAAPSARTLGEEGRLAELAERFAQSFLELRRGQHQLLRDLGLPAPSRDRLQTIDDPRELLSYLLDPGAEDRVDELSRAYADLMMHEVALLNAVSAGARELLDELSPMALAGPLSRGILGWAARLFGADRRWSAFEKRFEDLQEETALSAVVLGRSFTRAYAAALGQGTDGGLRSIGSTERKT